MSQHPSLERPAKSDAHEPVLLADSSSFISPIHDCHDEVDEPQRVVTHVVKATLHCHNASQLLEIGTSLLSRFKNLGQLDDLEHAIAVFQIAIELTPDNDSVEMSRLLNDLGYSLRNRFQNCGKLGDLERAVIANQKAVDIMPKGHPEVFQRLHHLGASLGTRFQHIGELADLEQAIALHQSAIKHMPAEYPDKSVLLCDLGIRLLDRFRHVGGLDDLNEAIAHHRRALELTPYGHPDEPWRLAQLGTSLLDRFRHLGELGDLERAIENHRHAATLTPEGHPAKPFQFAELGTCLLHRYRHLGELDDLERAIDKHYRAVELTPRGHPDKPWRLAQLGASLGTRFQHLGQLDDLECATETHQHAVDLTPEGHPDKPWRLAQLGISLRIRFQRLGDVDDVERAIANHRKAVKLTPEGHPDKPLRCAEFGTSLLHRFRCLGHPNDLEHATANYRHAVELTPKAHPDKPSRLSELGTSLIFCFQYFRRFDDLGCAIRTHEDAVALTPEDYPDRVERLLLLGYSLKIRFRREPTRCHFDAAVHHFMEASVQSLGRPSIRLISAKECASLLYKHSEFSSKESLLLVLSRAMCVLPEIVWLGHSIRRRYQETIQHASMVNTAVYVAIHQQALSQAIEWLEAGRSHIWSQILSLRTPLYELKEQHPDLAERLKEVSKQLQRSEHLAHASASRETVASHILSFASSNLDDKVNDKADRHRRLAIRYDQLLREIRRCPGFEGFLRPPKLINLLPALEQADGPVVFINVHRILCDALVLCPDGSIAHIPLPALSEKRASQLRYLWMQNLERCHTRMRRAMGSGMSATRGGASMFSRILERLWTWIVQPILQHLNLINEVYCSDNAARRIIQIKTHPTRLAHITWCPTGPLTQLPLHAAGIYDVRQQHRPHVFDFVVSSYTPSLLALLRCSQSSSSRASQPNMLLIAQPATPGLSYLPGTQDECARIRAIVPETAYTLLDHEQAVVAKAATVINQYPWVHLACHGVQDAADPTQSAFALYDGRLTLLMLMETVADDAELAFLSACQTAVGDEKIPEESVHLAAGMLVVGFKGVVATMWSIGDADAPIVAEAYYKKLLELRSLGAVGPVQTGAAYALHEAVKVLREKVGEQNFVQWAPFVHFGV